MLNKRIRRERKEWLDRAKSEERRVAARERKEQLLSSYERETVIPKEIRHEIEEGRLTAEEALNDVIFSCEKEEKQDEFSSQVLPSPIITTSRSPSDSLIKFAKMIRNIFPGSEKINRGRHMIKELVKMAIEKGHSDLIVLNEHKGNPSSIIISHLPHGPTSYFSLHHLSTNEPDRISAAIPAVVLDNLTSPLGLRVKRILSSLFPPLPPREKPKKITAFVNREDTILFKQYKSTFSKGVPELQKMEPSFSMRLYEIRSGTLDMGYAEKEFVFRPYLNTSRKKYYLST
ncbi:U3 small nucleolar ribonucleoprotein IMP4 [Nematocida sp. LUAm3]|nr:U3 small nucleolar ribonucleoprotein IMP4 [Nematocida sp. LUAm3]KAI5175215.1 U3 small nucleolar ribonucleoprotein IMP4 [Nematocida sp. LUAm2]KAI5178113.1 U3 small nucleolar ribonucleoprotein IMP4 [Nematocida sp. LUAm1]